MTSRFIFLAGVTGAQSLVILLAAQAMGVRNAGGVAGIAACLLIGAVFGAGVTALSMALAFSVRSHAQFFPITGFAGLPLTFASSALVPVALMPGWLRPAAEANPLTYATDAVRSLVLAGWQPGRLAAAGLALLAFDGCCAALAALALRRALR